MSIKINIDVAKLAAQFKEFAVEVEQDLTKAVANLATITHAKVMEDANNVLHSTRKKFMDSLGFEEIAEGIWVISVDEQGMFVEEGIPENKDMKPDLLRNATKVSKDGHRYRAIPFDYGKAPSQQTAYTKGIVAQIKANLKKENVPYKKIELNSDGSPKLGKLHEFDFGGDKGRLGGPGRGNTPIMNGVTIYQSMTASGNVRRDILTFRTVSSGPNSQGKWIHPGLEAKKFLDKAAEWAMEQWENQILPEVLGKYK